MNFYGKYTHERNYGCRIREYKYKGLRTVVIENELIKVSVLADKGTDIYEFVYKPSDLDFMWHSFNGIKDPSKFVWTKENPGGTFLDYYEGGWQELFPNIGKACEYMGATLGSHGEVCLLPWEYRIETDTPEEISVKFSIRTVRMPYYLEKTFVIKSGDPTLYINESVVNEGDCTLQFTWGHHPSFGPVFLDESCVIEMPGKCKARTDYADLGKYGILPKDVEFEWPFITGTDGMQYDLSKVPPQHQKLFFTFYLYQITEGWYKITNKGKKTGFGMRWDKDMFPIIWVWAPYGGAQGYPWYGRNFNLAIEPWSGIPGNLLEAIDKGNGIIIKSRQRISTEFEAFAFGEQ